MLELYTRKLYTMASSCPSTLSPCLGRWLRYMYIDPTRSDPDLGCLLLYGCVVLHDLQCAGTMLHQGDLFEYVWVCYEEGMLDCLRTDGSHIQIPMLDAEP